MEIALLIVLSLGGLVFLKKYFAVLPERSVPEGARTFGVVDAILVGLLLLLLVGNAVENFGKTVALSPALLAASCVMFILLTLMVLGVLVGRRRNPIVLFGLHWPGWKKELPLSLLALVATYPLILLTQVVVQRVMGTKATPQDILQFLADGASWTDRSLVMVTAIVCAPVAEEVIFRGYIYGVMRRYLGRWAAVVLASAVFAVIHMHLPAIAGLFIFAILLALIYEKTGSLWAPMVVHAAFNTVTVVCTLIFGPTLG